MVSAWVDHLEHGSRFDIVEAFLRAWAEQDIERCLAYLAPDITYSDNIGDSLKPYKGVWQGKGELEPYMRTAASRWSFLAMRPKQPRQRMEDTSLVQYQIEFVIRHRASGEVLFGGNRFVARIEGGLIRSIQVFHDAAMFSAFLRLIGSQRHAKSSQETHLVPC
ncbi:MAG: nuclear transport factor 2 family protein [Pseudomonadota bacterium]